MFPHRSRTVCHRLVHGIVSTMSVIMLTEAVARIHEIISGPDRTKDARSSAMFAARPGLAAAKASPQPLMSLNPNPTGVCISISH